MACPTCRHTLQGIGETTDGRRHFWCPRCGTLRSESVTTSPARMSAAALESGAREEVVWHDTEAPTIVRRARALLGFLNTHLRAVPETEERRLREAVCGNPDRLE